jgi:hypothetical protein
LPRPVAAAGLVEGHREVHSSDVRNKDGEFITEGNPAWRGKILIQQFEQDGTPSGWTLSSTRGNRDAAYHYLVKVSRVNFDQKAK